MRIARAGPAIGVSLVSLLGIGHAAWPAEERTVLDCRAIESDASRLECYDRVVDQLNGRLATPAGAAVAGTTGAMVAGPTQPATPPPAPATPGEALFGKSPKDTSRSLQQAVGVESPDSLEATVTRLARGADGKLAIDLDNDQAWHQIDAESLKLAAGDRVRIRHGLLGSYMLVKIPGNRSIRVRRTR